MRSVVHWDGDSFFASIEQASDRRLRGRPVAVGGARRGVVVSASLEARRFGIRPGLSMGRARRFCPSLVSLPGHFELYERFSSQIIDLCEETTPLVEPVAVGAAYLDLTGTRRLLQRGPEEAVSGLRRTVRDWLRVSLSAGIATNKTVARIAARLRKPGAQLAVAPGGEAGFLAPLPVGWLPGVGRETRSTLEVAGLVTMGDLAHAPLDALELVLGRDALRLQRRAQGVDEEPVRPKPEEDRNRRETLEFAEDVWEEPVVQAKLKSMLERLMARIRNGGAPAPAGAALPGSGGSRALGEPARAGGPRHRFLALLAGPAAFGLEPAGAAARGHASRGAGVPPVTADGTVRGWACRRHAPTGNARQIAAGFRSVRRDSRLRYVDPRR